MKRRNVLVLLVFIVLMIASSAVNAQKEIVEKRTTHSRHWLNEDGSVTAEIFQNPIFYEKDGMLVEIDPKIYTLDDDPTKENKGKELLKDPKCYGLKNEGYTHAAVNDRFQLFFSTNSQRPVRFDVNDGWIAFQPFNGHPAKGVVRDNSVYYSDVWEKSDLLYISYEQGLKEVIVLKSPGHPEVFSFRVELRGLEYRQVEDGSIELLNNAGVVQATIPKGFMEDEADAYSEDVEILFEERGNNLILMLVPDREWLLAEERVYPIRIDPSVISYDYTDVIQDAYVTGYGFTSTHGREERLEIGNNEPWLSNKVAQHSLLKFNLEGIPAGAKVGEAKAQLYLYDEYGKDPATVYVRKITSSWSETEVCWDNAPTNSETYKTYTINAVGDYTFDLDPAWVNDWLQNSTTHYGFYLMANTDEEKNLKYFYSRESKPKFLYWDYDESTDEDYRVYGYDPQKQPRLTVHYVFPPETPTNLRVDGAAGTVTIGDTLYTKNTSAKIKWNVPTGEITGYDLLVNGTKVNNSTITGTEYTVSLSTESLYEIQVRAVGYYGTQSNLSTKLRVVADRSVQRVTNLSVTPQSSGIFASWAAPTEQVGILQYETAISLTYDGTKTNLTNVGTATSMNFQNLTSQNSYYVWVRAYDNLNNVSSWKESAVVSPLPEPSQLTATSFAEVVNGTPAYKVRLAFTHVDAASYELRRTPGKTKTTTEAIATYTHAELENNGFVFEDTQNLEKHASYTYDVITYNKTETSASTPTSVSIVIPNIQAVVIPVVTDYDGCRVVLNEEVMDGQTIYTAVSSKNDFYIQSSIEDDESDSLKFIIYSRYATNVHFSPSELQYYTGSLSDLADGITEWYLSICEYNQDGSEVTDPTIADLSDPRARYRTPLYRFTIDTTPPPVAANSFEITDQAKVKLQSPLASREVYIFNIHVQDNVGGVGVKNVYFWNGSTEPASYKNLTEVLSNGNLSSDQAALIEKGELGVIIQLTDLAGSIESLIFPWVLEDCAATNRTVNMKVEDQVGNVTGENAEARISQTLQVDVSKPAAPDACSHTHNVKGTQQVITFQWEAPDTDGDIARFTGSYEIDGSTPVPFTVLPTQGVEKDAGTVDVEVTSVRPNCPVRIRIKTVDTSGWESDGELEYIAYTLPQIGSLSQLAGGYDTNLQEHYLQWRLTSPGVASRHELLYQRNGAFDLQNPLTLDANGVFTHHNLAPHATYQYRLVAYNDGGDLTEAAVFSATVPNSIPTNPVPTSPIGYGRGTVNFQFIESFDHDPQDLLTYQIYLGAGVAPGSYERIALPADKSGLQHNQLYTWYVTVDDGYGGIAESVKVQFIADTNPPTLSVTEPQVPYSSQQNLTVTVSDELSGVEKVTYHMFANDEAPATDTPGTEIPLTQTAGSWTGTLPLNEGKFSCIVTAYDKAGNTVQKSFNIWVDRTAPAFSNLLLGLSPTQGKYYVNNGRIPVQFTTSDTLSKVKGIRYRLATDPSTVVGQSDSFMEIVPELENYTNTLQLNGTPKEPYYLALAVEDWAGNRSMTLHQGPIYFDDTEPALNLTVNGFILNGNGLYVTNLAKLSATVTASDAESPLVAQQYTIRSMPTGEDVVTGSTWASVQNASLTPGESYSIVASATNGAGLVSERQSDLFVFENSGPKNLRLTAPTTELAPGESALFTFGAEDRETQVVQYQLAIGSATGGTDVTSTIPGQTNGWLVFPPVAEYRLTVPALADGTYYLTFVAVNAAGLTAVTEGSMTVNNHQNRVIVHDQGPYSMIGDRLIGWWSYTGAGTVETYRYRIVDAGGQAVTQWETVDGNVTQTTVSNLNLQSGIKYYFEVEAFFATGEYSLIGKSAGITIDLSEPLVTDVSTPAYITSSNLSFSWEGNDPESGIQSVQVALGTDYHATDVTGGWVTVTGNQLTRNAAGDLLTLTSGERYYLTLRVINGAGRQTVVAAPGIMVDDTPPPLPVVCDQGQFLNTSQPLQAHWLRSEVDPESGTVHYQWALLEHGESIQSAVWYPGDATERVNLDDVEYFRTVATAAGRRYYQEHGKTYYFVIKAINGAGLSSIGWSDGIVADATAPFIPNIVLLNAVNIGNPDVNAEVNYISSNDNLALWIQSYEDLSTIQEYYYAWGTVQNVDGQLRFTDLDGTILLSDPEFPEGVLTVFAGESRNTADQTSATGYSSGVVLDTSAPKVTNVKGTVSANRFIFDWEVQPSVSPVAGYEVVLIPTAQINGTSFNWTGVGLNTTYTLDATGLQDGKYKLLVRAYNRAGNFSRRDETHDEWGISADVILDRGVPVITALEHPDYVENLLQLSISGYDATSGIQSYQYTLGSPANLMEYSGDWIDVPQSTGLVQLPVDIRCIPDHTAIYVVVRVRDQVGWWSEPVLSKAIFIDRTAPTTPVISVAQAHINSTTQISGLGFSSEDLESGITLYWLGVSDSVNGPWLFEEEVKPVGEFSGKISGLVLTDGVYYVAMKTKNAAGVWSTTGFSAPIIVDTVPPGLTFANAGEAIILNTPPVNVSFTLTEEASVEFTLTDFTGVTETETLTYEAGEHFYVFQKSRPGVYTLKARLTDLAGNLMPIQPEQVIRVNKVPVITLPAAIYTTPGKPVTLAAIAVQDPENDLPLTYLWTPGDGQPDVAGVTAEHAYTLPGDYPVTLTVTDAQGGISSATTVVKVTNTVSGTLYNDETWSGEHHVYADVLVPAPYTLTIAPGTVVVIDGTPGITGYNHQLTIEGTLLVQGGAEGVTLRSATGLVGAWKGIWVEGTASIDGLTLEHAFRGVTVVSATDVTICNSNFCNNKVGIHAYGGNPVLTNTRFIANQIYGIKEDLGGTPVVTNCWFSNNGMHYYDEESSRLTIVELNELEGNSGNVEE